jgi:medium-chain acyl-[acyl-carrier-protein] hydrolase
VFCFPHAGGNAAFYRALRQAMPAGIDFCPIELPGRAARIGEPPITDAETLLQALSAFIHPLMTVPFAFFGHSTGACVAYHVARRMRSPEGRAAAHVFLSARSAPRPGRSGAPPQALTNRALRDALRRFGGTPAAVMARDELVAALLPTMRADLVLGEACADAGGLLPCPVTVFAGRQDEIDVRSLEAWRSFTGAAFRLRLFDGGHFYLTECPETMAEEMAGDLAEPGVVAMAEAG